MKRFSNFVKLAVARDFHGGSMGISGILFLGLRGDCLRAVLRSYVSGCFFVTGEAILMQFQFVTSSAGMRVI